MLTASLTHFEFVLLPYITVVHRSDDMRLNRDRKSMRHLQWKLQYYIGISPSIEEFRLSRSFHNCSELIFNSSTLSVLVNLPSRNA